jgi:hypothetical protein
LVIGTSLLLALVAFHPVGVFLGDSGPPDGKDFACGGFLKRAFLSQIADVSLLPFLACHDVEDLASLATGRAAGFDANLTYDELDRPGGTSWTVFEEARVA